MFRFQDVSAPFSNQVFPSISSCVIWLSKFNGNNYTVKKVFDKFFTVYENDREVAKLQELSESEQNEYVSSVMTKALRTLNAHELCLLHKLSYDEFVTCLCEVNNGN